MSDKHILENASIGWSDGTIDNLGKSSEVPTSSYEQVIDGSEFIILPGLINAHFHSTSSLLKGMAQDVPEIEWMTRAMAPLGKYLTEGDRLLGAKLAVLEGIRTGTTTFAEYSSNALSLWEEVYKPVGARMVAAETINEIVSDRSRQKSTDLYKLDYDRGQPAMDRTTKLIQASDDDPRLSVMYGPQALDMVTTDRLEEIKELADKQNLGIHMHVAQGEREKIQIDKRYNKSTIDVLSDLELLAPNLLAAHCHGATSSELQKMSQNNVKMVSCQSSIGMIDGIVPPLYAYSGLGGIVGIGIDQIPGVGHANLFREMRTGAQFAKVINHDPTALPPWQMLRHATVEGATVLGIDKITGMLKVGRSADLITVDKHRLSLSPVSSLPIRNLLPNLVYSMTGYEVKDVYVQGKKVLDDGDFINENTRQLSSQANRRIAEIVEAAESEWRDVGSQMVSYHDEKLL